MDTCISAVLAALDAHLPIFLEEGDTPAAISLSDLERAVAAAADPAFTAGALAVVDRLFAALGLLSDDARAAGSWRFLSFPAWLLARSTLQSMATSQQRLVAPGYWSAQPAERDLEEQRTLLRHLEERRVRHHPLQAAPPIRFVHVAWALIQVGGRILLLHREDRTRADARGNFVLPGGRFRLADSPPAARPDGTAQALAYKSSTWPHQFLERTLARELHEELELVPDDDYTATPHLTLPVYRHVEGARNHIAYSEYAIVLFALRLTLRGYLKLLAAQAQHPGRLAWFTPEELVAGNSRTGATAFIDALRPALNAQPDLLAASAPSFAPAYRLPSKHKGLDLPLTAGQPLCYGKTGDSVLNLDLELSEAEVGWLLALGWHAKGLPFAGQPQRALLADGWVAISADDLPLLAHLQARLDAADLPIVEIVSDAFARLSIPPHSIFFDPALFIGSVETGALRLRVRDTATPIGAIGPLVRRLPVGPSIAAVLAHLAGTAPLSVQALLPDSLPRMVNQELGGPAREFGVRQILDGLTHDRRHWRLTVELGHA